MGAGASTPDGPSDAFMVAVACREGQAEAVKLFLSKNQALATSHTGPDGSTPLHWAALHGHIAILESLLEAIRQSAASSDPAFDPVAQQLAAANVQGCTPLMLACKGGHPAAARLLMDAGASVWQRDALGCTCLHHAAGVRDNHRTVRFVLARAAQEQQQQQQQQQQGEDRSVERLVNLADRWGRTALMQGVWSRDVRTVQVLLAAGAQLLAQASEDCMEMDLPCNGGHTALHVAALRDNAQMAALLLGRYVKAVEEGEAMQDPRTMLDAYGVSAYAIAVSRSSSELQKLLSPKTIIMELLAVREAAAGQLPRSNSSMRRQAGPATSTAGGLARASGAEVACIPSGGQEYGSGVAAGSGGWLGGQLPAQFFCPLTQQLLVDPVVCSDGYTYERAAFNRWLQDGNEASPVTGRLLHSEQCYSNTALRQLIADTLAQQPGHHQPDQPAIIEQLAVEAQLQRQDSRQAEQEWLLGTHHAQHAQQSVRSSSHGGAGPPTDQPGDRQWHVEAQATLQGAAAEASGRVEA